MPKRIRDQVIVITGASSGIGLVTAQTAARAGARVVLAARNRRDLERAVEEIRREGGDAIAVPTDVTEYGQVKRLAEKAVAAYGRIDTWVNNAGVSAYGLFRDQSVDEIRRVMEVNFMGQVHGAKAALPHLELSRGALICVGSTLSDRGVPLQSGYCASKHALKGWLDSLRVELRKERSGVRVTLVKPSSINTPLFNNAKTQLGVMPQPIPPIYEPELAASAILRAAEGDERDVFVGGGGKLLSTAERLSPRLVDVHQRVTGFASQRTDRAKSAEAPNNLHRPLKHDGGPRGDFGRDSRRRSLYQTIEGNAVVASIAAAGVLAVMASAARTDGARRLLAAGAVAFAGKSILTGLYEG